jgi:6-pyruvoyltetrahydropterin/6-carboxytetrahydropterin synthase
MITEEEFKMIVTKEFTFDSAHMLSGHEGLCKNLHGHTYKLRVGVKANSQKATDGSRMNMIVDFSKLKDIVKKNVVDIFDHAFIYNTQSKDVAEHQIREILEIHSKRVLYFPTRATAEEMSKYIFRILMKEMNSLGCNIAFVELFETPTSSAICTEEDVK